MKQSNDSFIVATDARRFAVRRLNAADASALPAFHASLGPTSQRRFFPHRYDDATVARALARAESGADLLLGVFDGERLVGYFFLWYFKERVPLLGIGLHDDLHGQGLGRQMMQRLIDAARENGNEGIELTTMQDNQRAFALYQAMGFRYTGDVENLTGDGTPVIERAMFCEIIPGARPFDRPHCAPV